MGLKCSKQRQNIHLFVHHKVLKILITFCVHWFKLNFNTLGEKSFLLIWWYYINYFRWEKIKEYGPRGVQLNSARYLSENYFRNTIVRKLLNWFTFLGFYCSNGLYDYLHDSFISLTNSWVNYQVMWFSTFGWNGMWIIMNSANFIYFRSKMI